MIMGAPRTCMTSRRRAGRRRDGGVDIGNVYVAVLVHRNKYHGEKCGMPT